MKHLERFFSDFPAMQFRHMISLPPLGRRFENYYPDHVLSKATAYVRSQITTDPDGVKKSVKVADLQATLAGLVQDANRRMERVHAHRTQGEGQPAKLYKGTGSVRAAKRIRVQLGLTNTATKHSKHELTLDSPEMVEVVALVRTELQDSVPELLCNIDEMWRRQMRDDRLKSLKESKLHHVDVAVASPTITIEDAPRQSHGRQKARVSVQSEYGSWVGPWHPSAAACEGDRAAAQRLAASAGTYRSFDEWQRCTQGRRTVRRRRGRRPPPKPSTQTARVDVPPGSRSNTLEFRFPL